jgi:hypothetical protein
MHQRVIDQAPGTRSYDYEDPTLFETDDVPALDDTRYPQDYSSTVVLPPGYDPGQDVPDDPCTGLLGQPAGTCCGLSGPVLDRCLGYERPPVKGRGPCRTDSSFSPLKCNHFVENEVRAQCGESWNAASTAAYLECHRRVWDYWTK